MSEYKFIKTLNGKKAPKGFHYMPNGKLMSDADHVAVYGYIEKTIKSINIDTRDVLYSGEIRNYNIRGDEDAIFSIEIKDDSENYYNFRTNTFSSTKSKLDKASLDASGLYSFNVKFPSLEFTDATCDYNNDPTIAHDDDDGKIKAGMTVTGIGIPDGATVSSVTSDTAFELSASTTGGAVTNGTLTFGGLIRTYTVNVFAETAHNIRTKHVSYTEVRFVDDTIDVNSCTGSNSNIVKKTIYQDIKKYLYLRAVAPSLYHPQEGTTKPQVSPAVSSSNRIVINKVATDPKVVQVGDLATATGLEVALHPVVDIINPDGDNTSEIQISVTDSISDETTITFTPPFNGSTPSPISGTGQYSMAVSSGQSTAFDFTVTCTAGANRLLSLNKLPTTDDLCAYVQVTFGSAALAISGEDTDSASKFHRWPVTNIAGLAAGMKLDSARGTSTTVANGANTTTPAQISSYKTTKSSSIINSGDYSDEIIATTIEDVTVPAIDPSGNSITAMDRTGRVTAQAGNIVFDVQQLDALKSDANVRIFGHGTAAIKQLTGSTVKLSNIKVTPTQISTTTTAAVDNSITIPLTEVQNISQKHTVRGIGIDASVANPTVAKKKAGGGGAEIELSAAQTLESGATLFFDGASNVMTITGTIEIDEMGISDTTIYFDLEKFLTAS